MVNYARETLSCHWRCFEPLKKSITLKTKVNIKCYNLNMIALQKIKDKTTTTGPEIYLLLHQIKYLALSVVKLGIELADVFTLTPFQHIPPLLCVINVIFNNTRNYHPFRSIGVNKIAYQSQTGFVALTPLAFWCIRFLRLRCCETCFFIPINIVYLVAHEQVH